MNLNWSLAYTPFLWPMIGSAILSVALGVYTWRRRGIPGTQPFAMMLLFMALWSIGAALQLAAVSLDAKIFWFKFTAATKLPVVTAELCFGLQYTGLGRFLKRGNLVVLAAFPLLFFILILTNDSHQLVWPEFRFNGVVQPLHSPLTLAGVCYSYLLGLVMLVIFGQLFVRSLQHRWTVVLVLTGWALAHTAVLLDYTGRSPFLPMDSFVLMWNIGAVLYAVALFGFRMFDPIPLANQTVIAQMHTGMLVVDSRGQVISLNPAAQTLLGVPARQAVGQPVRTWLPWAAADGTPPARERDEIEIQWGQAPDIRHYRLEKTVLKDWRGQAAGCLVLLHDVTRQKQAQARLVEQQRALATLDERERLARELHDTIGQLLGYVGFQVDAVSKLVLDGESDVAMAQLGRLGEMVRAAHADVREQILDLHTAPAPEQPFFVVIGQYLDGFTHNYNIQTRLLVEDPFGAEPFSPDARMQVLRILQEALSNARKHGRARRVEVSFGWEDQQVRMVVQDDGAGFDSSRSMAENEGHFGLRFMRERAEALGGRLEVTSEPDQGTRVVVWAPRQAAVLLPESEVDHA